MKFFVYRLDGDAHVLIAWTIHENDANAVLKNWARGYVKNSDGIVRSIRGLPPRMAPKL